MTEEQIKQNAEAYAKQFLEPYDEEYAPIKHITAQMAYIAGAHSRDKEIECIKNEATAIMDEACALKTELNRLRNPWISVEERLPEITYPSLGESDFVFVHVVNKDTGAEWIELSAKYNEHFHDWLTNDFTWIRKRSGVVTHWMPIPEIQTANKED